MRRSPGLDLLVRAADKLGLLLSELVFVGGAVIDLHITDLASPLARPTQDVDAVVDVATRAAYERINQALRKQGFRENTESGVICRWVGHDLVLDVMPISPEVLGFSNRWYESAYRSAQPMQLPSGSIIQVASAIHILATKLVAMESRGTDLLASHDLEDIVLLLNGRPELFDEIDRSAADLRSDVLERLRRLIDQPLGKEAIEGALAALGDSSERARSIETRLKNLPGFRAG